MRHSKSRFIESRSEDPDISGDARRVGTGAVRKPHLLFSHLVGTVGNSADAVRFPTAPTGEGANYVATGSVDTY